MAIKDLKDLFEHELKDIYYAEHRLVEVLDETAGEVTDPNIKKAFTQHKKETQNQIKRLDKVFKAAGEQPEEERCQGIEGLIREKKAFNRERPSEEILNLFSIGAAMKTERYEITAYENLIMLAQQLGMDDAVKLLQENLSEEEATLEKLHGLAKSFDTSGLTGERLEEESKSKSGSRSTASKS